MKFISSIALTFVTVFLLSCSKELHTTRQAKKNIQQIQNLSINIFGRFNKETFFTPNKIDSLNLSKSDRNLLYRKLKSQYIQVIYTEKTPRFIETDSVILFTRTGLPIFGSEHNIVVDMRKVKRDTLIVNRQYTKFYKIAEGIYYIQDPMPTPAF